MKILSLDLSSVTTGYCVFNNGKLNKASCGTFKTNPKQTYGQRLFQFSEEIKSLIQKHKPDQIVIEDIFRGRSVKTFKSLATFRGVAILTIFTLTGKDPLSIMAAVARKTVGAGKKKEEAFAFAKKKYKLTKYNFKEHNDIADAIILGLAACEELVI